MFDFLSLAPFDQHGDLLSYFPAGDIVSFVFMVKWNFIVSKYVTFPYPFIH